MANALPTCEISHAVLCCLAITNLSAQGGDISYLQMYVPFNLSSNIIRDVMTLTVTVVEYLNKKTDMKEVCTSIHYIILCKPKNAMHTCVVLWIVIVGFWSNLFVIIFYSHNLLQNIFEPTGQYHNHNFKTQSSTTPSKAFKQERWQYAPSRRIANRH